MLHGRYGILRKRERERERERICKRIRKILRLCRTVCKRGITITFSGVPVFRMFERVGAKALGDGSSPGSVVQTPGAAVCGDAEALLMMAV